jgi:hypothetical protein
MPDLIVNPFCLHEFAPSRSGVLAEKREFLPRRESKRYHISPRLWASLSRSLPQSERQKALALGAMLPNLCAKGWEGSRMSVLPHRAEEPENDAQRNETIPSLRRVQGIANSALDRTRDATANALDASRDAWAKGTELRQRAARSQVAERIATLADKTATQTRAATATAVSAGKVGFAKAAQIGRDTVLPEMARAGVAFRERTRPERLKQDWREFLFWLHANADKGIEKLFFRPTAPTVPVAGLEVKGTNRAEAHDYRPTPKLVFDWALASVPEDDLSKFAFVDYGAGKGRVLLLASERPFAVIGGIEFATELHDDATMNIAQYPRSRMKCRNVECVHEDAAALGPLAGDAIHYFFDAFSREVFGEVLNGLVASYRNNPRRLYLILIDQEGEELIEQSGVFRRVELPPAERVKVKLFSPHGVAIYRSLA